MWAGMGGAAKRGLSRLVSNWQDAADQSLFFGSRAGRDTLVGGAKEMKQMMSDARASHSTMKANIEAERNALDAHRPKANASPEDLAEYAEREKISRQKIKEMQAENRKAQGLIGGQAMDVALDSAKAVGGWAVGSDRAGQGWARTRAVAARAGMVAGTGMAVGTAGRYATGGTFTRNRDGERDIAGIPFV